KGGEGHREAAERLDHVHPGLLEVADERPRITRGEAQARRPGHHTDPDEDDKAASAPLVARVTSPHRPGRVPEHDRTAVAISEDSGREGGRDRMARLVGVRWLAIACVVGLTVACFGPVLNQGRQLAYRDYSDFYYPLYQRVQQEWDAGRLPLWSS